MRGTVCGIYASPRTRGQFQSRRSVQISRRGADAGLYLQRSFARFVSFLFRDFEYLINSFFGMGVRAYVSSGCPDTSPQTIRHVPSIGAVSHHLHRFRCARNRDGHWPFCLHSASSAHAGRSPDRYSGGRAARIDPFSGLLDRRDVCRPPAMGAENGISAVACDSGPVDTRNGRDREASRRGRCCGLPAASPAPSCLCSSATSIFGAWPKPATRVGQGWVFSGVGAGIAFTGLDDAGSHGV